MTDVKRLLAEASPLPWHRTGSLKKQEWQFHGKARDGMPWEAFVIVYGFESEEINREGRANAELIEYAVNTLPDYEAAVDALERFVQFHSGHVLPAELANTMTAARAALARLRGAA